MRVARECETQPAQPSSGQVTPGGLTPQPGPAGKALPAPAPHLRGRHWSVNIRKSERNLRAGQAAQRISRRVGSARGPPVGSAWRRVTDSSKTRKGFAALRHRPGLPDALRVYEQRRIDLGRRPSSLDLREPLGDDGEPRPRVRGGEQPVRDQTAQVACEGDDRAAHPLVAKNPKAAAQRLQKASYRQGVAPIALIPHRAPPALALVGSAGRLHSLRQDGQEPGASPRRRPS